MEGQREGMDGPMGSSGANISNPQEASAPYANTGNAILWTDDLHQDFLQAVEKCGGAFVARPKNIKSFMRSTAVTTTQIKSHLQRHRQRLLNQGGGTSEAPSQGAAQRPLSASQGGIARDPPMSGWGYPSSLAPLGGMQPPAAKRHRPAPELGASLLTLQSLLGQPPQQAAGPPQALQQQQQQQPWIGPLGQQQPPWPGLGGPPPGRPFWAEPPPGFVAGPGGPPVPPRPPQDSPRPPPPPAADPLDAGIPGGPLPQGPMGAPGPLVPPLQGPWRLPLPPPPSLVGAPASMSTWLSTVADPPGGGGAPGPGAVPPLAPPGAAAPAIAMAGDPTPAAAAAVGGSLMSEPQGGGPSADEEEYEEGSYGLLQGIAMLATQQYRVQQEILEHMQALHGLHARLDSLGAQMLRLASAFHDQQMQQLEEQQPRQHHPQQQQQQQRGVPAAAPQPLLEAGQARPGSGPAGTGTTHAVAGSGPLVPSAPLRPVPREQQVLLPPAPPPQQQQGLFPPLGLAGPPHGVGGMAWEVPPGPPTSVMSQLQELLPLLQQALAHPEAREQLQAIAALASSLPPAQGYQHGPHHLPSLQALVPAQQQQGEPAGAAAFFGRQLIPPYALQRQQQQQQGGPVPGYQPGPGGMADGPLSGQAEPSTEEAIAVLQRFLQQMGAAVAPAEDERGRAAPRDKDSHGSLTAYSPAAQEPQQQQDGQGSQQQQQQRHDGHSAQQQQRRYDGHSAQQQQRRHDGHSAAPQQQLQQQRRDGHSTQQQQQRHDGHSTQQQQQRHDGHGKQQLQQDHHDGHGRQQQQQEQQQEQQHEEEEQDHSEQQQQPLQQQPVQAAADGGSDADGRDALQQAAAAPQAAGRLGGTEQRLAGASSSGEQ